MITRSYMDGISLELQVKESESGRFQLLFETLQESSRYCTIHQPVINRKTKVGDPCHCHFSIVQDELLRHLGTERIPL